jgi:hypothetical protein
MGKICFNQHASHSRVQVIRLEHTIASSSIFSIFIFASTEFQPGGITSITVLDFTRNSRRPTGVWGKEIPSRNFCSVALQRCFWCFLKTFLADGRSLERIILFVILFSLQPPGSRRSGKPFAFYFAFLALSDIHSDVLDFISVVRSAHTP